ncbi:hypothetical protein HK104_006213 [Borealophlyctis nickersoniae]|nr:hypothetical protein HK104_006213 [Borealophlyctis nickersoniae]
MPNSNGGDVIIDLVGMAGSGTSFLFLLQILLVGYMYGRMGSGLYWKSLLIISTAGIIGATFENFERIMYVYTGGNGKFFAFSILAEPCWIVSEFGVVALNLVKIRVLTTRKVFLGIGAVNFLLFLAFCALRIRIGVIRFKAVTLNSTEIWNAHTPAFAIIAVAEGLLTCTILFLMYRQAQREQTISVGAPMRKRLVQSSMFVLLLVDFVGMMLAITSSFQSDALQSLVKPFLALKSCSALILGVDAIILKGTKSDPNQTTGSAKSSFQPNNATTIQKTTQQNLGQQQKGQGVAGKGKSMPAFQVEDADGAP